MDIGPEHTPFIAEPVHDPFRRPAEPDPAPAPDLEPVEPPEQVPASTNA